MKTNKSCIIFSSWIPLEKIELGKYYIDTIFKNFKNFDIFVGVNNTSCDEWVQYLKNNNINYSLSSDDTNIDSDVTGFMAAIELYKKSNIKYSDIWFAHSKGASYPSLQHSEYYRQYLENNFWCKQETVKEIFKNKEIGLIANTTVNHNNPNIDIILNKMYNNFIINSVNYFIPNTFFITDDSINEFIFSKNFNMAEIKKMEDRRYFFEAYFCIVPIKLGKKIQLLGD